MSELQKAYQDWVNSNCGCYGRGAHVREVRRQKTHPSGVGLITYLAYENKPDNEVCLRERYWRRYCKLRDEARTHVSVPGLRVLREA